MLTLFRAWTRKKLLDYMNKTQTDAVIDPGTIIPSVEDLIEAIIEEETKMVNKFEVGDKVRIVKLDITGALGVTPTMKRYLGEFGVVVPREKSGVSSISEAVSVQLEEGSCYFYMPEWLELVEKAKKPWNGKVICVDSYCHYFTKGKIYEVKNGALYDDTKTPFSLSLYYDCPTRISASSVDFIEFKGFANE